MSHKFEFAEDNFIVFVQASKFKKSGNFEISQEIKNFGDKYTILIYIYVELKL